MERLRKYLAFFSIAHLFFVVLIFFGLGIFTEVASGDDAFSIFYLAGLAIVATLAQTLVFTAIARYFNIEGVPFFVLSLFVELLLSNIIVVNIMNSSGAANELPGIILLNACLIAAFFISMIIREYNAESFS